jgi:hypothetical protein
MTIIKETKQYRHIWSRIGQFLEEDWKVIYLGEAIELRSKHMMSGNKSKLSNLEIFTLMKWEKWVL